MNATAQRLSRTFLAGLLAALPLAATALILIWVVQLLVQWVGPDSLIGRGLIALGIGAAGSEFFGYLMGIAIVVAAIFALGVLVRSRARRVVGLAVDGVMQRIPLVRNIYDLVKKFVDLLSQKDADGVKSMSAVWLHFGGPGGAAVLGLLSTPEPVNVNGLPYLAVLVPTAPVPVGGGLLYVPQDWVTPADIGVEGVTSIYVSMGITSKNYL
ncbi:DUF502 domain-containing protein [Rhizobacter sp. Root1221]|uniref:DUF502 domain-containing protein n=1 Tax=Rhizobacter sp. Root1221 TaxID=1736433 RepID=UPI0006F93988|nr:DUF502 domain-containing protein [Rhizobacter sp. Root1221]KQV99268.1 hypothetical protein ASC87_20995 [Rhizobacter sp. Root1221]